MKQDKFQSHEEFSGLVRLFHWLRAFAIFGLICTGFYIAYPFLQPTPNPEPNGFLQAIIRSWHLILGFVLIAVSIFRFYLFCFDKKSQAERKSFEQLKDHRVWIGVILSYLWVGRHPHIKGAYNPLQFITYFVLAVLVLLISLTGISLYTHVYHSGLGGALAPCFKWVEVWCGGLANVRFIHHIVTWLFVIFIPVHIYLAVWNAIKFPNGGVDSIVSGIRYEKTK